MIAYIARDGAEIGSFERAEIEELAATGELLPTDYYWHEGMENWLFLEEVLAAQIPVPQEAPAEIARVDSPEFEAEEDEVYLPKEAVRAGRLVLPKFTPRQLRMAAAVFACLLISGVVALSIRAARRRAENEVTTIFRPSASAPSAKPGDERALRDKAAADLKQRIERLPARAVPPLSTFYYDVSVNMKRSFSSREPWTAEIHGRENVIDPATDQTARRTEFFLTSGYRDGEWSFKHYRGLTSNMADASENEEEHDEHTPTPPSIVGMLGLKRPRE